MLTFLFFFFFCTSSSSAITRDSASDELYSDEDRFGGGRGRSASLARRRQGARGFSRDRGQSRYYRVVVVNNVLYTPTYNAADNSASTLRLF